MPPRARIHDTNERTITQWYLGLPVVTRSLLAVYVTSGLLMLVEVLPLGVMYHSWRKVFSLPVPQVWRLFTNFAVCGGPNIKYLFQLVWLVQYGAAYESAKFLGNTADALTMLLVGMTSVLTLDALLPFLFRSGFHGAALIFMLVYLWSKQQPDTPVSLFGVMTFQALYLPFALLAIELLQGQGIMGGITGILAGHIYYFLTEVYPRTTGRHLVQTPTWLARAVHRYGLGRVPVQQLNAVNPTNPEFRPFAGRGRRLAD